MQSVPFNVEPTRTACRNSSDRIACTSVIPKVERSRWVLVGGSELRGTPYNVIYNAVSRNGDSEIVYIVAPKKQLA
jgi:hypothetical protein